MNESPLPMERQIDRAKILEYLLHPVNSRGKAELFYLFGFSQVYWERLRDALLEHAQKNPVTDVVATRFGTKYIVTGALNTPNGRVPPPIILAVWQQDPGETDNCLSRLGDEMLNEHTQVVLKRPLPNLGLEPGDVGIVVHVHGQVKPMRWNS